MFEVYTGQEKTNKIDNIRLIFDHWKAVMNCPRAQLDHVRKRKIETALSMYTVEFILNAINGCAKCDWNMGRNPSGKKYNDIELILRNAKNIERFEEMAPKIKKQIETKKTEMSQLEWEQWYKNRYGIDPIKPKNKLTASA